MAVWVRNCQHSSSSSLDTANNLHSNWSGGLVRWVKRGKGVVPPDKAATKNQFSVVHAHGVRNLVLVEFTYAKHYQ